MPPSIVLLHGVQSSRLSWWRFDDDLQDLGWQVHALDLLGHGARRQESPAGLTLEALARDVLVQAAGPVDLLVGHSLGALVALVLTRLDPGYARALVIEDPPGLAGPIDPRDVARDVAQSVRQARADPEGTVAALLVENPRWALAHAEHAVQSRLELDVDQVTQLLRTNRWDLQALVRDCPIPVRLLAATAGSALLEPDRTALMNLLPSGHVAVVDSDHSIHRDRPALWLQHVLSSL